MFTKRDTDIRDIEKMIADDEKVLSHFDYRGIAVYKPISEVRKQFKNFKRLKTGRYL